MEIKAPELPKKTPLFNPKLFDIKATIILKVPVIRLVKLLAFETVETNSIPCAETVGSLAVETFTSEIAPD